MLSNYNKYDIKCELVTNIVEMINESDYHSRKDKEMFAYMFNEGYDCIRVCDCCSKLMIDGHFVDEAYEYYCSDECLEKAINKEEIEHLYKEDLLFWTEWL